MTPQEALRLRERRPGDMSALVEVLSDLHAAQGYPSAWPADPAAFVLGRGGHAWVAEVNGRVVGQVMLSPLPRPVPEWAALTGLDVAHLAEVGRLYVSPRAQGQGVARALLRQAGETARADGQHAGLLVNTASAPAIGLYETAGWQLVGTVPGPWTDPDGSRPSAHVYLAP